MKYLISDTREKKNQHVLDHFDKVGIRYEIAKLDYGDYMDAYRTDISIDRKQTIGELARNCTRESERFKREIERANKADSKLVILVEQNRYRDRDRWIHVESIVDLMLWSSPHTKIRGEKVYRALSSLCSRYNFEVVFCDKRSTGKKILEIIYGDSVGDRQMEGVIKARYIYGYMGRTDRRTESNYKGQSENDKEQRQMTKLTASLNKFLMDRYPEEIMLIKLGHAENFTDKMKEEYMEWVQTAEGRSYLAGGANYHDPI